MLTSSISILTLTYDLGAGVVVAVGELVKDIKIGDHAGIKWLNGSCGTCDFCKCPHNGNDYSGNERLLLFLGS